MDDFSMRCPRCKQQLSDADPERLTDTVLAHLEQEHGHAPPREHVRARIDRVN